MTITGFNGRRVFVPIADENEISKTLPLRRSGHLLTVPISYLIQSLEVASRGAALRNAQQRNNVNIDRDEGSKSDGMLWVDKYAPTSFQDLLSDEVRQQSIYVIAPYYCK